MTARSEGATFVTLLGSAAYESGVRLAIASLREFGGEMARSPVLVLASAAQCRMDLGREDGTEAVELEIEPALAHYPFGAKVAACAQAEARVRDGGQSLVYLGASCLVANPPLLFRLGSDCDAAFRPVHVANIGSPRSGPLDDYWRAVYAAADAKDGGESVESLLDCRRLRPYYNTHCFAVSPNLGLMAAWVDAFRSLVADRAFQSGPCRDDLHRIFLHQAVLSTLLAKSVAPNRLRLLPPSYSYPLHFHSKLAVEQRVRVMNDITVAAYEDDSDLAAVPADEPLRSWRERHVARSTAGRES